jgi:hypothetical protein
LTDSRPASRADRCDPPLFSDELVPGRAESFNNVVEASSSAWNKLVAVELARVTQMMAFGEAAAIAHEIHQPLGAVVVNAKAGLRWLAHEVPNLDEARAALSRIVNDGDRTSEVIAGMLWLSLELDGMTADRLDDLAREISTRSGTAEMMRYIYASLSRMIHK